MKSIIVFILSLFFISAVSSQSFNKIPGKQDFTDSIKFSQFLNSVGEDSVLTIDRVTKKLKFVLKGGGSGGGVDSCTSASNGFYYWKSGTPTLVVTPNNVYSFILNYDSTYQLIYRNSVLEDSISLGVKSLYPEIGSSITIRGNGDSVFIGGGSGSGVDSFAYRSDLRVWAADSTYYVDCSLKQCDTIYWTGGGGGSGSYVPYTGATSSPNLGEFGISEGFSQYDTTVTTYTRNTGNIGWNDTDGTLEFNLKGNSVSLQIGQETVLRVVNKTGSNLLESQYLAVYVSGAQGQRVKVNLASANADSMSAKTIGVVTENIAVNQEGFITTSGLVREINTTGSLQSETWADGDILYLSPTINGGLTNIKPTAPQHTVLMGYCVYAHAIHGSIFVKVVDGFKLDDLHNVKITTPLNNEALVYETATKLWKNKAPVDATKLNISDTASMLSPYKTSYPRQAISLTTTGTSGAATYSNSTGILNVPQYSGGSGGGSVKAYAPNLISNDSIYQRFNVTAYGAIPDDTLSDQFAIQAAINAAYLAGGGEVFLPNGVYYIKDTLVTGAYFSGGIRFGTSNSQLYIPSNQTPFTGHPIVNIQFVGESAPNMFFSRLVSYPINRSGAVLYSTITGSGTEPSILGAAGDSWAYGNINDAQVSIRNINFRVKANISAIGPTMSGVNLGKISSTGFLENILCDTDTSGIYSVYPTASTFGVKLPNANNSAFIPISNCVVTGYKYGYIFSEHATGNNLAAGVCEYGFKFTNAPHSIYFGRLLSQWNKYSIDGNQSSYIKIDELDIETDTVSTSWTKNRYHIYDSTNQLKGDVAYHNVDRGTGVSSSTFNKLGATNLQLRLLGSFIDTATRYTGLATIYKTYKDSLAITASIPAQVNPIAGTDMTITGTYPNFTFNSTAATSAGGWTASGANTYRPSNFVGIGAIPLSRLYVNYNALGATNPDTTGVVAENTTAAAAGAQQWGGSFWSKGRGWATTGGVSQSVAFGWNAVPIQGAANPSGEYTLYSSINGAAPSSIQRISSAGLLTQQSLTVNSTATFGGGITQNNGAAISLSGVVTSNESGLAATPTDFLIFSNGTNATSGVSVQNPGMINYIGKAWDGTATRTSNFRFGMQQTSGSSPITTNLVWSAQVNGGGYTDVMKLYNNGRLQLTNSITLKSYTVATLPTGNTGDMAYVTDATSPTYLGALTGGGSVVCPVFFNGSIWVSH